MADVGERLDDQPFCYLTTTGRTTGKPHTIEIWFSVHGQIVYLLSGGGDRSDWVRNLVRGPDVGVRIAESDFPGRARLVTDPHEDQLGRDLLVAKYQPGYGGDLTNWKERSLLVAIDLELREPGTA